MNSTRQEVIVLWAEYSLDRTKLKSLIDFAVRLLDTHDTDNIRILAGLEVSDSEEVVNYFFRVLKDLAIIVPEKSIDLYIEYAKIICQQLLDNERKPLESLHLLSNLFVATDYSSTLADFDMLDTDVMNAADGYVSNPGLTPANADNFIRRAAKVFLASFSKQLPPNWHELHYCKNCHKTGKAKYKSTMRSLFKLRRHQSPVCGACGSENLIYCDTIEGKEIFFLK